MCRFDALKSNLSELHFKICLVEGLQYLLSISNYMKFRQNKKEITRFIFDIFLKF